MSSLLKYFLILEGKIVWEYSLNNFSKIESLLSRGILGVFEFIFPFSHFLNPKVKVREIIFVCQKIQKDFIVFVLLKYQKEHLILIFAKNRNPKKSFTSTFPLIWKLSTKKKGFLLVKNEMQKKFFAFVS